MLSEGKVNRGPLGSWLLTPAVLLQVPRDTEK